MKLSNKILIGLFGFVYLYMMAAFAEVRFRGYSRNLEGVATQLETAPLADIGYIVLADVDKRITISTADEPRIEIESIGGGYLPQIAYEMKGDTLQIKSVDFDNGKPAHVKVFVPKDHLRGILVERANASITHFAQTSLTITQTAGSVMLDDEIHVTKLSIMASEEASLNASGLDVDSLEVQLNHARVNIWSEVGQLSGSITNDTFLNIKGVEEIQFSKDKTSKLQIIQ